MRTELGGKNLAGSSTSIPKHTLASYNYTPTQSTDVGGIVKGVESLLSNMMKAKERRRIEQNKEDEARMKYEAQVDIQNIESALKTGYSENQHIADLVAEARNAGLTDMEVTRTIYDSVLGEALTIFGEDRGSAEEIYVRALETQKSASFSESAVTTRKQITEDVKNVIYQTLDMPIGEEDYNDTLKNSIDIGNYYNISPQEIQNLAIQKAFERAKEGDNSYLDKIQDVTYNGVKIVETLEGSSLYNKLREDKDNNEYVKSQRAYAMKNMQHTENLSNIYGEMVNDLDNVYNYVERARGELKNDILSVEGYNAIERYANDYKRAIQKASIVEVDDPEQLYTAKIASLKGHLTPDLLFMFDKLTANTLEGLLKASAENSVYGEGNPKHKESIKTIETVSGAYFSVNLFDGTFVQDLKNPILSFESARETNALVTDWYNAYIYRTGEFPSTEDINLQVEKVGLEVKKKYYNLELSTKDLDTKIKELEDSLLKGKK